MNEEQKENTFHRLKKAADIYAENKAKRVYLHEFRKSKKSLLMKQAETNNPGMAANAQEREAYAHPEYLEVLRGLEAATELEVSSYWKLKEIEMRFETWRTKSANERSEKNLR